MISQPVVSLRYRVGASPEAWVLPGGPVPESTAHDAALNHIYSLLAAWAARVGNGARVARNLAFRWLAQHPKTGLDPDISVLLPAPMDFDDLTSVRLWEPGRTPPLLAVEVVSSGHPYKDYARVHEGYAAMGVAELIVFDPLLFGPKALGGPVALQLWQRDLSGTFERVHFGSEPFYSQVLGAWVAADGRRLKISDDSAGVLQWPTLVDEARRAAESDARSAKADAERARAELALAHEASQRERQQREALEARLRELEAQRSRD